MFFRYFNALLLVSCSVFFSFYNVHALGEEALVRGGEEEHAESVIQSKVIYYYRSEKPRADLVDIYLDGEFVTALRPGFYKGFCVGPGAHLLGASFEGGSGADRVSYRAEMKAGATYYLEVGRSGVAEPVPVGKDEAQSHLSLLKLENRLLSRASQIEPCAIGI